MNPALLFKLVNSLVFKNRPIYAHFGITHRCNLQCRMCKVARDIPQNEELSIRQIEEVFDILKRIGVIYVSIGGGEPFLRNDLSSVVKSLIKKGFMVRLLTNGTLAGESLINDLASAGLREVSVSLDTLDPGKFAHICNSEGVLEKIMKNLDLFSKALPEKNRLLLINAVVSPLNIKELPELTRFAQEKGYYISFIPVEAGGIQEFIFKQGDYKYIDESYDYLIKAKKNGAKGIFNSSMFLEKSRQYLKSGSCNWQCDAGRLYLSLNPKGELSICHRFRGISLLSHNAGSAPVLKELKDMRKGLVKGCPGCMRPCWAEISFLFKDIANLCEMCKIKF